MSATPSQCILLDDYLNIGTTNQKNQETDTILDKKGKAVVKSGLLSLSEKKKVWKDGLAYYQTLS